MKRIILGVLCCTLFGTAQTAVARDLTLPEKKIIMDVINNQLKDPDSAKYYWLNDLGGDTYCAHINSKNSYGGYAGKTPIMTEVKRDSNGRIKWAQGMIVNDPILYPICTKAGYKI